MCSGLWSKGEKLLIWHIRERKIKMVIDIITVIQEEDEELNEEI